MALPSLADVVMVIVLLLPGFVSFIVFKWISIVERKFSDFEMIVASLFCSLLIYAVFSAITGISDIDSIRDAVFLPNNVALIMGLSLVFGIIPGVIVKHSLRRRIARGDCWDVCMGRANKKNSWVIVYTKDGLEYKGILHVYGAKGERPRELVIEKPKQILRDKSGKVSNQVEMGSELLFLQDDIRRIVFFKSLRKQ